MGFDVFKDYLQGMFKKHTVLKTMLLFFFAAYAVKTCGISGHKALTIDWWIALAEGTFAKMFFYAAPAVTVLILALGLFGYLAVDVGLPIFPVYAIAYRLMNIAVWMVQMSVPGAFISACTDYIVHGDMDVVAYIIMVFGDGSGATCLRSAIVLGCIFLALVPPNKDTNSINRGFGGPTDIRYGKISREV